MSPKRTSHHRNLSRRNHTGAPNKTISRTPNYPRGRRTTAAQSAAPKGGAAKTTRKQRGGTTMDLINMIPETVQLIIAGLSMLSGTIIGAVAVKHLLSKLPADKVSDFATAALIHALWPLTYFGEAAALHGTAGKPYSWPCCSPPSAGPSSGSTACWRGSGTETWPTRRNPTARQIEPLCGKNPRIKPRPEAERLMVVPLFPFPNRCRSK